MNTTTKKQAPAQAVATTDAAGAKERVKLEKPHTDAGITHAAGTAITVTASTAEWLRARGVVAKKTTTTEE